MIGGVMFASKWWIATNRTNESGYSAPCFFGTIAASLSTSNAQVRFPSRQSTLR
jgi:hypothetical protein